MRSPKHPYTQALLSAVPVVDPASKRQRIILPGDVPSPINPPPGCNFHPRCPAALDICKVEMAPLREIAPGHFVACHVAQNEAGLKPIQTRGMSPAEPLPTIGSQLTGGSTGRLFMNSGN